MMKMVLGSGGGEGRGSFFSSGLVVDPVSFRQAASTVVSPWPHFLVLDRHRMLTRLFGRRCIGQHGFASAAISQPPES